MKKRPSFAEYLAAHSEDAESFPFLPIIEVAGNQRVLIENHSGVCQYSGNSIQVHVQYGRICISGHQLTLMHMSKCKLVITGWIEQITLVRREER